MTTRPPLPEPKYVYHFDIGAEKGEDDLFEFASSGAVDENCPHCERLYTADQVRTIIAAHSAQPVEEVTSEGAAFKRWVWTMDNYGTREERNLALNPKAARHVWHNVLLFARNSAAEGQQPHKKDI